MIGTEFVPDEDRGEFHVLVDLPPGTSFDQSVARVSQIEQTLGKIPEALQVFSTVGIQGEVRSADIQVTLTKKNQRKRGIAEIKAGVREEMAKIPFAEIRVTKPQFLQGAPNEPPLDIYVRGDNLQELQRISDELTTKLKRIPGAVDIKSSLVSGQPEMVARINREMAADLGFDVGAIGGQLRGMVEGIVPTKLRDGDREHDIRVRLAPEFRNDFATISRTPLYAPAGAVVRASDLVHLEPGVGPSSIDREQRRRQVKVGADLSGSRPLGDVSEDVQKALASVTMPANFEHGFAGDVELMQESAAAMGLAMILAVAFIYIVLASQFESFAEPMLIMLSLPLAVVGALLGLLFTGHHIGMPAMIGVVMLMGLVTKNAILLVDYTNQLHREEGLSVVDALLKAGPVRLRPIVMTTLAMILGMLPSALGRGDGGEFRAPISVATIGGLITSTLLTLLVVPVSYLLLSRLLGWMRRKRTAEARLSPALRVTGAILLALLLGGLIAASNAFGGTLDEQQAPPDAPLALTFDTALEIALRENNVLKVDKEVVHAAEGKVQEARANFLPTLDLSYSYTPAQQFPLIRIPAGIFGDNEQTFQAAFTRQNIMQLSFAQPLYTGGRLRNNYAIQAAASDGARATLERARQELILQVVESFYRALLQEQGVSVAEEGVKLAQQQLDLAKTRFEAGTAARFDVLRAEVDVANAKTTLIRARTNVDIAYQALRSVLSLPTVHAADARRDARTDREAARAGRAARQARWPPRLPRDHRAADDRRAIGRAGQRRDETELCAHGQPSIPAGCLEQHVRGRVEPQLRGGRRVSSSPDGRAGSHGAEGDRRGGSPPGEEQPRCRARQRPARGDVRLHRVGGVEGRRRRAAEGAGPGARESVDRAGVVREWPDHVDRAVGRATVDAPDAVESDAGEVRADPRGRADPVRRGIDVDCRRFSPGLKPRPTAQASQ